MAETKEEPKTTTNATVYYPEYRIYKPNNSKTGAASKLQLKVKQERFREVYLFWESTQQTGLDVKTGNATFGWDLPNKKITFKMEPLDIGEVLCVLTGKKVFAGAPAKDGKGGSIFHQTPNGNTVFKFSRMDKDGAFAYWLQITAKKKDGTLVEVKHVISAAEGEVLRVILQDAISCMFNWK